MEPTEDPAQAPSGLRHRNVQQPTNTPPPPPPAAAPDATTANHAWEDQLAAARQSLAARMHKQMTVDSFALDPAPAVDSDSDEATPSQGAERVGEDRRGSSGSEEEDDAVREMLGASGTSLAEPVVEEDLTPNGEPHDHAPPDVPEAEAALGGAPKEEKMCRICFDGEDEELGRLFSPCQCRGTARFVHVVCLDRWRKASAGATAFFKCDQCGYEYKLRRTKIAGVAQNKLTLVITTSFIFVLMIYLAGFIANGILYAVENRTASLTGSPFEDIFVSDYVIVGEGMREAVEFFGKTVDKSGWKAIKNSAPSSDPAPDPDDPTSSRSSRWFRRLVQGDPKGGTKDGKKTKKTDQPVVRRVLEHFIKGFSLVGIAAFFQTFVVTALFGPFGLRGSLFRAVRPTRRQNGDSETNMGQIVIVMFVLVGAVKAIHSTYKMVRWVTKLALTRVEGLVLDV